MTVRVRLFAAAREAAGTPEATVDPGPLPDLLDRLEERFGPAFAACLAYSTVLVDGDAVARDAAVEVSDGSEVAVLPPVSGGQGADRGGRARALAGRSLPPVSGGQGADRGGRARAPAPASPPPVSGAGPRWP